MSRPRINVLQAQSIIAAHMLGLSYKQIASDNKVCIATVGRILNKHKQDELAKRTIESAKALISDKEIVRPLAWKTLVLALSQDAKGYDVNRAAPIAVQVLRGLGELAGDIQVGIQLNLADGMRLASRYIPPTTTSSSKLISDNCDKV